jgi:hypothetical protein
MTDEEYLEHIEGYSPNQLEEALRSLDREKFPQRVRLIEEEFENRKKAGEYIDYLVKNTERKELVSWNASLAVWWAFTWRTTAITLLISFVWMVIIGFFFSHGFTPPRYVVLMFQFAMIILSSGIGIIVMRSVLSKMNYRSFRIVVAPNKDSNNRLNPISGSSIKLPEKD